MSSIQFFISPPSYDATTIINDTTGTWRFNYRDSKLYLEPPKGLRIVSVFAGTYANFPLTINYHMENTCEIRPVENKYWGNITVNYEPGPYYVNWTPLDV
jgi:hypothetical protein